MSAEEPGTETIAWPEHVGVAGLSLHAKNALLRERLGSTAAEAVAAWSPVAEGADGAPHTHRPTPESFPFQAVLDHYRAVGRSAASVSLVGELRRLSESISGQGEPQWQRLKTWLRAATDQLDGDYHSYAGTALLTDFLDRAPLGSWQSSIDTLMQGLLIDQLRTEAAMLAIAPSAAQRRRTNAVLHAVGRADELAPRAQLQASDVTEAVEAIRCGVGDAELAELASKIISRYALPEVVETLMDLVMIPSTPLHDEQMFLRSIHLFECVYSIGARALRQAADALERGDTVRAAALLGDLATRFSGTATLYRILTTMPPPAFAIIRHYTAGRSAVQSYTYRQVEQAAAPSHGGTGTTRTLQEVLLSGSAKDEKAVRSAMLAVDDAWCAMKRTHWGITVKTIGYVPGTGGTAGASYLQAAADQPLFPALAAARGSKR